MRRLSLVKRPTSLGRQDSTVRSPRLFTSGVSLCLVVLAANSR